MNTEGNDILIDMPSRMDHWPTIESYKEAITAMELEKHNAIGPKLNDLDDFVPKYKGAEYETREKNHRKGHE